MPSWGELLVEVNNEALHADLDKENPIDTVRRRYLLRFSKMTGRNVILYSTKFTIAPSGPPDFITVNDEDMCGLMETIHGLDCSKGLDIILHSPGGDPTSAERIVKYLRSKFPTDIRVFIPHMAMSAATMIACASNEIIMTKHSFIGPIDPQMTFPGPTGNYITEPATAILDQFEKAKDDCSENPNNLQVWMPILAQYGPAMLTVCENWINLSELMVSNWIYEYMFNRQNEDCAKSIAKTLADHRKYLNHSRSIDYQAAKEMGLKVSLLEDMGNDIQDCVLSAFHATNITFNGTQAVKIIENQLGKAFIKSAGMPVPLQFPQE